MTNPKDFSTFLIRFSPPQGKELDHAIRSYYEANHDRFDSLNQAFLYLLLIGLKTDTNNRERRPERSLSVQEMKDMINEVRPGLEDRRKEPRMSLLLKP